MKPRGIKQRWMFSGIAFVVAVVVVFILLFSLTLTGTLYTNVQTGLESRALLSADYFSSYGSQTYADFYQSAYKYTQSFEDKDILELQFINTRGRVEISSYGITTNVYPDTPDIRQAMDTGKISPWRGRDTATGERILTVSAPLYAADGTTILGVMRYVTGLRLVDHEVMKIWLLAAGLGLLIILVVIISNLYFIRTITEPILKLTAAAQRIADGSYGIQVEKTNNDEIGDLTDAINEMSQKIGRYDKMQTEFISSVSHELRTPLTAITGWSETLAYDDRIQGDSRRGLAIIYKEANRLTKMVEELLEFTRMQDGRFNLNVEPIDIAAELEDSIYTYRELLRQEQIQLNYTPPWNMLPYIMGDAQRLKQVFLNILDNASKYGGSGGKIDVSIQLENEHAVVQVRDYGPGIPEKELPHVKEKFYKGSSKARGSGIGLAVCDEIVVKHNGELRIANAYSGGTVVTIRIPVIRDEKNPTHAG